MLRQSGTKSEALALRITRISAALAVVVCAAALAQHIVGIAGFSWWLQIDHASAPFVLAGILSLCAAVFARVNDYERLSRWLLVLPISILAIFLAEQLFADKVMQFSWWLVGTKSGSDVEFLSVATPAADLFLLTLATFVSLRFHNGSGIFAVLLSSLTLALAVISLAMLATDLIDPSEISHYLLMSPSAALASILLCIGLLAMRQESGWPSLLNSNETSGYILRAAFPAVIILPVVTMLVELLIARSGMASAAMAEVIAACANVIAFVAILLWSVRGIARSQAALTATSRALDASAVMITDLDGVIRHWSEGCERLYGWTRAEAVGQSKYHLLGTKLDKLPVGAPKLTPEAPSGSRTLQEQCRSDEIISVVEQAQLLTLPNRNPELVLSMNDISELVATTEKLKESEARLEVALDTHSIGIFEWKTEFDRLKWYFGSHEQSAAAPWHVDSYDKWASMIEPEDLARTQRLMDKAVAAKAPSFAFTYRFNGANAEQRVIEASCRCIYDENDTLIATIGVNIDITDRVRAHRAMQASSEQFRSVLETVPNAMLIVDEEGTVLSYSKSAEAMFGYSADEIIGHHIRLLTGEDSENQLGNTFTERHALTATGMRTMTVRRRKGTPIPVEVWVGEFETNAVRLFTIFMHDISGRIQAQERMDNMSQELVHVARLNTIGEITAGIAHELNQPLSAMANFLTAAKILLTDGGEKQEKARNAVQSASDQALRAGKIIRRLRALTTKGKPDMVPLSPDAVVNEATEMLRLGTTFSNVEIHSKLAETPLRFMGDRVQIQQVVINLVRNALDAIGPDAQGHQEIVIDSRLAERDMLEISVSDTGPGLPPEVLQELFTPFVSTKKTGMGVGLSICRRIVEAHGGTMSAQNRDGGGAVFRFTLPIAHELENA